MFHLTRNVADQLEEECGVWSSCTDTVDADRLEAEEQEEDEECEFEWEESLLVAGLE